VKVRVFVEFIGLLSKLYFIVFEDENGDVVIKRAKGNSKGVAKHELTDEDYRRCLFKIMKSSR
jgi:hypothetical protein